jgi:hypothetical protein
VLEAATILFQLAGRLGSPSGGKSLFLVVLGTVTAGAIDTMRFSGTSRKLVTHDIPGR